MRLKLFSLAVGLLALSLWTLACGRGDLAAFIDPVNADEVCMVQKYYMGPAKQTPVVMEGKTYYVCCQGCHDTLKKSPLKERFSVDPVSGKTVDKAEAVLGKAKNGQIHFFENEANRAAFQPTPTPLPSAD